MAFPTVTTVSDAFSRANENPASGGWQANDMVGRTAGSRVLQVVGNQVAANSTAFSAQVWNTQTGPDCEVAITVATKSPNNNSTNVYQRIQTPGSSAWDGYGLSVTVVSGTDQWRLYRVDNDALTQLGSTTTSEITNADKIGFEIIGSTLTGYQNTGGTWTSRITASDSTYSGTGYSAFESEENTARYDDWITGTVAAGGGSVSSAGNIATAEAVGSQTITPGAVSLSTAGNIGTSEAFGTARLDLNVTTVAIGTAEAVGTHTVTPGTVTISPSGIASAEAIGTPSLGGAIASAGAIGTAEAVGSHTVAGGAVTISPSGIASAEAVGTPTLSGGAAGPAPKQLPTLAVG